MSDHSVTVQRIGATFPIEGKDRIQVGTLMGMDYRFIIPSSVKQGDLVVYFPVDTVLPAGIIERLGLTRLKDNGRVRTMKMAGVVSQGLCLELSAIAEILGYDPKQGDDLTAELKVTRWEPTEGTHTALPGELVAMRPFVTVYDIENAQRHVDVIDMLMDRNITVQEKLEGEHHRVIIMRDGEIITGQRRYDLLSSATGNPHVAHTLANEAAIRKVAEYLFRHYPNADHVQLLGELVGPGIQGNHYTLNEREVYFFEARAGAVIVPPWLAQNLFYGFGLVPAPIIWRHGTPRQFLADEEAESVVQAAHDRSRVYFDVLREGIVIRLDEERPTDFHHKIGRFILKVRDPIYLERTGR